MHAPLIGLQLHICQGFTSCLGDDWLCLMQSFVGLGIFWVILLGITGAYVLNYIKEEEASGK